MATEYELRSKGIGTISEDQCRAREAKKADERHEQWRIEAQRKNRTLYCDGCHEEGRAGIGVITRDGTIHISEEVVASTNNQAECISVIRGLEECLRLGYRPAVVLSDSQLVVCWTNGQFAAKSDTARKYTPQIRTLLKEVGTSLQWIPGKRNLADRPSREAIGVWRDPAMSQLQVVCSTPIESLRFRDFAKLKSGRDQYSKLRLPALAEMVDVKSRELVVAEFGEQHQAKTYRWILRGLPVQTAIRKVKVDLEITENAIGRARRSRNALGEAD